MAFANPSYPNQPDFITFCQNQGVTTTYLPTASDYYTWSFDYAYDIVYSVPEIPQGLYVIAVYNLGMHHLLTIAQDTTGLALTSLTWAGGQVTATTTAALAASVGETITVAISGSVPLGYNGTYTAVVTGANTFVYELPTDPGTVTQVGTYGIVFFSAQRKAYQLLSMVAGPIQSSSDESTSQSIAVSDMFKNLTFSDIDFMKTPWGRQYLSYAQTYGPTVVGVS